jgi:hypothetical protein
MYLHSCRYAALAAYALRNVALASANDFAGFDEVAFWQGIATWDACFPRLEISNLRSLFESDLIEA